MFGFKEQALARYELEAAIGVLASLLRHCRHHGLDGDFKLNIEANHATLAGHTFAHDLRMATDAKLLGSIDANRGDPQNGWDTDQFPNNASEVALAYYHILASGGFTTGGTNFDAKLRRQSIDPDDLLLAHVGAMDICARGVKAAAAILEDGSLQDNLVARYAGWEGDFGGAIMNGGHDLESLATKVFDEQINPKPVSGKQEVLENIVNRFV